MNERIKFLWQYATFTVVPSKGKSSCVSAQNIENFAKLIIQEYTHELRDLVAQRIPASEYASLLEEKFGVEE